MDDGAGDEEVGHITARPFELPGGKHGVRVDWTFKLYELRTRMLRDRNKNCREGEEVALSVDESGALIAGTRPTPPFGRRAAWRRRATRGRAIAGSIRTTSPPTAEVSATKKPPGDED